MLKKYKIGFNLYGAILFAVIMLPNIIWALCPAANDILRKQSNTPSLDIAVTVFQVLLIISLIIIVYKDNKRKKLFYLFALIPAAAYYVCWFIYYFGTVTNFLLLLMALLPGLAFVSFSILDKNYLATAFSIVFTVLHIISTCINFL